MIMFYFYYFRPTQSINQSISLLASLRPEGRESGRELNTAEITDKNNNNKQSKTNNMQMYMCCGRYVWSGIAGSHFVDW